MQRLGREWRCAVVVGLLIALVAIPVSAPPPRTLAARAEPARTPEPTKDFDGDSYADLVLGTGRTAYVLYGSPTGPRADATRLSRFTVEQLGGPATTRDASFKTTAVGDFDGDSYADLAVWVEDWWTKRNAHGVHVVYGSPTGLTLTRTAYRPFPRRIMVAPLASGNFGRGRFADLAVGDDGYPLRGDGVGAVHILYGSPRGLGSKRQTWHQDSPGVLDVAEDDDRFGWSVVADDFGRGRYDDLAIGATGEGGTPEGDQPGAVQILYGSSTGLTANGNQLFAQGTPGLRTPRWTTFWFGDTLASGHFAGRAYADLAIGSPGTQVAKDPDPSWSGDDPAGTVNVLYGSSAGLTLTGNQLWTRNGRRIEGRVGNDSEFGGVLVAADFGKDRDGDAYDDLAIGACGDGPSQAYYGAFHVIYGSSRGLTSTGDLRLHEGKRGVPGVREDNDGFGCGLAAADYGRDVGGRRYADLAVATAGETLGNVDSAGRVHVFFGSPAGITVDGVQVWTEQSLGGRIRNHASYGDGLGTLLTAVG